MTKSSPLCKFFTLSLHTNSNKKNPDAVQPGIYCEPHREPQRGQRDVCERAVRGERRVHEGQRHTHAHPHDLPCARPQHNNKGVCVPLPSLDSHISSLDNLRVSLYPLSRFLRVGRICVHGPSTTTKVCAPEPFPVSWLEQISFGLSGLGSGSICDVTILRQITRFFMSIRSPWGCCRPKPMYGLPTVANVAAKLSRIFSIGMCQANQTGQFKKKLALPYFLFVSFLALRLSMASASKPYFALLTVFASSVLLAVHISLFSAVSLPFVFLLTPCHTLSLVVLSRCCTGGRVSEGVIWPMDDPGRTARAGCHCFLSPPPYLLCRAKSSAHLTSTLTPFHARSCLLSRLHRRGSF